jgi:pimeloyl-ACP methyl ester carboxylesterase
MEDEEFAFTKLVSSNQRGVKVSVTNNTGTKFYLLSATLESGDWAKSAPLELPGNSTVKFGCLSNAFMTGVAGKVSFGASGRDKSFRVAFSNPYGFLSRSEVTASSGVGLEVTADFTCTSHAGGYYLHGNVEIARVPGGEESPAGSPSPVRQKATRENSGMYESIINAFIRPTRHVYDPEVDLGPQHFSLGDAAFLCKRSDLVLRNKWGKSLQCSWFDREDLPKDKPRPCVVYCHANSGSRCNAKQTVRLLLPFGISVFTFDFSGSGLSEGEYVTLGSREQSDIECVVAHLREQKSLVSRVAVWGRSMGAVATLLYARSDPRLAALVCDSPFSDLQALVQQLVQGDGTEKKGSSMPSLLIDGALYFISAAIEKRCDLNLYEVSPVRDVAYMRIPVLFLHGTRDVDVPPSHSDTLFNNYGSEDKCLLKVDQGHNSLRPADTNEQIARFLAYRLSGSLVGYRELLGNAASDPPDDSSSLDTCDVLPSGWSSST